MLASEDRINVNGESQTKDPPIKFPLSTEEELRRFEETLQDKNVLEIYTEHLKEQLKTVRNATTIYGRRKRLKELIFSE